MRIFKTFALLFICVSLFAAGGAQAAMPCCTPMNMARKQIEKAKTNMPCHKDLAKQSDTKTQDSCQKCKHCANTAATIPNPSHHERMFTILKLREPLLYFISHEPDGIYSPPKCIS